MPEYDCKLMKRGRAGPGMSLCTKCKTGDCENSIVNVDVHVTLFGDIKERLYCDSEKPVEERKRSDYWSVLVCEGFR